MSCHAVVGCHTHHHAVLSYKIQGACKAAGVVVKKQPFVLKDIWESEFVFVLSWDKFDPCKTYVF